MIYDNTVDPYSLILPDGSSGIFESSVCVPIQFYRKFDCDGFRCLVDFEGIIFIARKNENFERPCMRACISDISIRSLETAKAVLALSCELQDDPDITERARGYLPPGKDWYNSVK